ncbi:hypothetical protein PHYC_00594 [Phycisphaerales bacterium]|nr:hypothetical protein PHYC_00594 [Phycisphaerales bacterium]
MSKTVFAFGALALVGFAGAAFAGDMSAVDGYRVEARIYNDFPTSNLQINGVGYPAPGNGAILGQAGPVLFQEAFAPGGGGFANKHVAWMSQDGGASRLQMNGAQSWSLAFTVRIAAPAGQPRKEAGIEIHNPRPNHAPPYTDEGQVLIASDGEVAVFGAVMPFTGFGNNTYTLGTTAQVLFEYFSPGTADPVLGAYRLQFNDAVTGMHDSGMKFWSASEPDGTAGFNSGAMIGFKSQNQRNPFITDTSEMEYNGITITPSPASIVLLGLGALSAARRRR